MNWLQWLQQLFGKKPTIKPQSPVQPPVNPPILELPTEQRLIDEINAQRFIAGVQPVVRNDALSEAARDHAGWMVVTGRVDHGNTAPQHRAAEFGYRSPLVWENVAAGQRTISEVMEGQHGWMRSPGHRVNILRHNVTDVGVGIERDSRGVVYWCLMLGQKI